MHVAISFTLTYQEFNAFQKAYRLAVKTYPPALRPKGVRSGSKLGCITFIIIVALLFTLINLIRRDAAAISSPPLPLTSTSDYIAATLYDFFYYLILVGIPAVLLVTWARASTTKRIWRSNNNLAAPQQIIASPESLILERPHTTTHYQWPAFQYYYESPTLFLLFISIGAAHIIPKRVFATAQDCDAFRSLVQSHIPLTAGGFPVERIPPVLPQKNSSIPPPAP